MKVFLVEAARDDDALAAREVLTLGAIVGLALAALALAQRLS